LKKIEDRGLKIEDRMDDSILDPRSSILDPRPSTLDPRSSIFLPPSLRYYFSRRNFDFNNVDSIRDRATVL